MNFGIERGTVISNLHHSYWFKIVQLHKQHAESRVWFNHHHHWQNSFLFEP
jgi:hypothetical protein